MKKVYIILGFLIILSLTSMMLIEKQNQPKQNTSELPDSKPLFYKGMITIKVKEGVGEFENQRGCAAFNISSLDAKALKFEVNLLEKRFRYNPKNLKSDLPDLSRIYRIEFPEKFSVSKVAAEFSKDPNIEYAEPIPIPRLSAEPNDTMYGDLHHLTQIHAEEAWEIHKGEEGEEDVVIAIVDSGVEWDHEDLVDNIWQNLGEDLDGDGVTIIYSWEEGWIFDPGDENGIDDDGNGYIDDFIGWNFFLLNNDPNPTPGTLSWGHGTHCAGLASATTDNGIGVASVSWNLKILPIQGGFYCYDMRCYDAVIYAAENGADVISNSWGYYVYSQANHEACSYAIGLGSILVGGACNDQLHKDFYPASYPGVISIAAINHLDQKASYSNYGPQVTVGAPGGETGAQLLSTGVNNTYTWNMGCSMATPITAGLFGLVKSYHPEWSSDQVITQVLGTADDIDSNNPGFENQLGAGRINAYRALFESGVTLQHELALDLVYSDWKDSDDNQIPEPGDTLKLSLKLRNYNYGISDENATFTLSTDDTEVLMLNDTYAANIPADDYFVLEDAFEFVISEEAQTHLVEFELITNSDKEITWGDTITVEVLVAPSGILVYQGEGLGNTYSGDTIKNFLVEHGFDVFYTSHFPASLIGFNTVFMSFGNYGDIGDYLKFGTPITFEMTQIIAEYLYQGGNIYIECGTHFGTMEYFGYPNYDEMMELFGVEANEKPLNYNNINLLTGLPGSICANLEYTGSSQSSSWFIDKMTPNDNGIAAFEEVDYGTVAVQGEGEYGQKTFCFAYALAHLDDGAFPGTREELLHRICEFFNLMVGVEELQLAACGLQVYPNPSFGKSDIRYQIFDSGFGIGNGQSAMGNRVSLGVFDIRGKKIRTLVDEKQNAREYTVRFDGSDLPAGIYLVRFQVGEAVEIVKVVVMK